MRWTPNNEPAWNYLLAEMAAAATAPGPVVVDGRDLDFMGCGAFTASARAAKRRRRRGIGLCLVSTRAIVARIVAACALRWVLAIYPTVEALSSPGSSRTRP